MRKIEAKMVTALSKCAGWKSGNTSVTYCGDGVCSVFLYGHHIATVRRAYVGYSVEVNLRGYNTATTRSRLSAILHTYLPGVSGIGTKQGQAYIVYRDGTRQAIAGNGWVTV